LSIAIRAIWRTLRLQLASICNERHGSAQSRITFADKPEAPTPALNFHQ
jgi:hypothetical protein